MSFEPCPLYAALGDFEAPEVANTPVRAATDDPIAFVQQAGRSSTAA